MRILLSAYACEPNRGSEAEIGWGIALELAGKHEVWVLTRANNKAVHDREFARTGQPANLHFLYYDLPAWMFFWKWGKRFFLFYYYLWQMGSYCAARRFLQDKAVDVVHHLTGGMDFFPSGMSLVGKPFVWGPVGGEDTPEEIKNNLPLPDRLREMKRCALRYVLRHFDPFMAFTRRRADLIVCYSSPWAKTAWNCLARYRPKIRPGVQTGLLLDHRYDRRKKSFARHSPFTVMYAGHLIHWKGGRFVAEAFARFARQEGIAARLVVIGDGPLRGEMERVFAEAAVADRVQFLGFLPMQELLDTLPQGDVFFYPTYHHGLANICLQAMVMGLPMVCLEGDGIATAIAKGGGIAVPVGEYRTINERLAAALTELYHDEAGRVAMAQRAQQIVMEEFQYKVLAQRLDTLYAEAVALHGTR